MKALLCLVALAACDASPAAPNKTGVALTVTRAPATIEVVGGLYQTAIPFVFTNSTSHAVANPGCHAPVPPRLEWWDGTEWTSAYDEIELLCLGPPYVIAAGAALTDTLHMQVFVSSTAPDGTGQAPSWLEPLLVPATYRLAWNVCDYQAGGGTFGYTCTSGRTEYSQPFPMHF